MLTARNLTFSYDHAPVLADLDLSLERGTVTCLLGPSGCGKSTLIDILAGLRSPASGSILCDYARPGPAIGLMAQDPGLLPWLNAEDNVRLAARLNPQIEPPSADALAHGFHMLELSGYEKKTPGQLSGGQQQRVALLRTLLAKPKLMLLDEPLGHLDTALRMKAIRMIRAYVATEQAAALVVTHQAEEALRLADVIVQLGNRPTRVIGVTLIDTDDDRREAWDMLEAVA